MNIQWYPGHMTRAFRDMTKEISLVDIVIELCDARIPLSSRNPKLADLGDNKKRLILFNKADLADEVQNKAWADRLRAENTNFLFINSTDKSNLKKIPNMVRELTREKTKKELAKGMRIRPVRAMVVGIPNVGKSTFINSYAGGTAAKTGNKPGITKGLQWIRLDKDIQLLDTPGVLWGKFSDSDTGRNLALIGSMKEEILNSEELAGELISFLSEKYPGAVNNRYNVDEDAPAVEIMEAIGRKRGCLIKGGEISYEKTAFLILEEFRSGKLGRITIEWA